MAKPEELDEWLQRVQSVMNTGDTHVPMILFSRLRSHVGFEQGRDLDLYLERKYVWSGPDRRNEWTSSLLSGCCNELTLFEVILSCLCPCIISAKIRNHYDGSEDWCFNYMCLMNPCTMRILVETGYNLKNDEESYCCCWTWTNKIWCCCGLFRSCCSCSETLCFGCCLYPCSLAQTLTEVRSRGPLLASQLMAMQTSQPIAQEFISIGQPWNESGCDAFNACDVCTFPFSCLCLWCCCAGEKAAMNLAPGGAREPCCCCWLPMPLARSLTRKALGIPGNCCSDLCCGTFCYLSSRHQVSSTLSDVSLRGVTSSIYDSARLKPRDLEWERQQAEKKRALEKQQAEDRERRAAQAAKYAREEEQRKVEREEQRERFNALQQRERERQNEILQREREISAINALTRAVASANRNGRGSGYRDRGAECMMKAAR